MVFASKAIPPTAVFLVPVVFAVKASTPIAVLFSPVYDPDTPCNASNPTAVLLLPIKYLSASFPIAVF